MSQPTKTTMSQKDIKKAFKAHSIAMLDINHLYKTIKEDFATDIKVGDYVISTDFYDSSIFVVDPLVKTSVVQRRGVVNGVRTKINQVVSKQLSNPYEENVIKPEGGMKNITIKAKEKEKGSFTELRIKVKKLCLLDWDEITQTYPRQSIDIIFRQRNINFAELYGKEKKYCEYALTSKYLTNESDIAKLQEDLRILNLLISIPPFLAFYDRKYGFLIKRELKMTRVIMPFLQLDGIRNVKEVIEENVEALKEQVDKKKGDAVSLKEAICMEKFKPERVERAIKKAGGLEHYDPEEKAVVSYGKAKN